MRISQVEDFLKFSIKNNFPVLLVGSPGIGKTSIVEKACKDMGYRLISEFLSISDPIDFKGALFAEDGEAEFLPAGTLNEIVETDEKIVFFLDDIGQGSVSTQAAAMQLVHGRKVGEKKVGKNVVFMGATNRAEDGAGVSYLIEPLKSRFRTIIEVAVTEDDWIDWAIKNGMPASLIGFIRFRPEMLNNFKATRELTNSSNPRSVAGIGDMLNKGLEDSVKLEVFKGAAGESFAIEFHSYLEMEKKMPDINTLINNPHTSKIPEEAAIKYAIYSAMSMKLNEGNFKNIVAYTKRMGPEFEIVTVQDAIKRCDKIATSNVFTDWAMENHKRLV